MLGRQGNERRIMTETDYFNESVPDGIANAINEFDPEIKCCGQDGYELLVMTFGADVSGSHFKAATEALYEKFAEAMKSWFELESTPTIQDAKTIITKALRQWGG